jgi:hypothetical protein
MIPCFDADSPHSSLTSTTGNSVRRISPFEQRVLVLLDALLGRTSPAALGLPPLPRAKAPSTLRRSAVELIQQRLRRGLVSQMARDGWKRTSFFQNDQSRSGRLWERHRPESLHLTFSPFVVELLFWLASADDIRKIPKGWGTSERLTPGDRVLACLAWKALRESPPAAHLPGVVPWSNDGMVRLLWANDFVKTATPRVDFGPWFKPETQWILEAWQDRLIRSFLHRAANHRQGEPADTSRLVEFERRSLDSYLRAANAAGRRDLTLWIVTAADRTLREGPPINSWFDQLDVTRQTIESRYETYRSALFLFELLDGLRGWNAEARRTGFMDEDYAAAQHWKTRWEALDAENILSRSDSLRRRWSSP